ncbi:MAG: sulfurtransferase [Vicinamibacterales bacterium]
MTDNAGTFETIVDTDTAARHLDDPAWVLVDCRFQLAEPEWGRTEYLEGHVPGAVYAHLDEDLSGPVGPRTGRHPLPDPEALRGRLASWGIRGGVQVVAYDQDAGLNASRLWWLLRAFGHRSVAVLDGGYAKWLSEGRPTKSGDERRTAAEFIGTFDRAMFAEADEVARLAGDSKHCVIDVRAPERFRGESEPIDPVPGRIPGAVNRFSGLNLTPQNTLRPAGELREELARLFDRVPSRNVVVYCGSGVYSCHTLLAMVHAGFEPGRLYAGSWSEWCRNPDRPVGRGAA